MKIIEVMPEFGLAGAETMCENLTRELTSLGHEVIAVSLFDYHSPITERLERDGIRVEYLNKKPGLDLSMIPKLISLFRREKPDVVHTHRYVMQYVIPAAHLAGVPGRFHTVHNIAQKETTPKAQKLNRLFYRFCHVTPVALSSEVQETIQQVYGIQKNSIPVVYNGIPLDLCIPKTDYTAGNTFQYLHIGRFSPQKNHLVFLKSFRTLLDQGVKAHLTLVGTGELESEIRNCAAELHLEKDVTFFGTTGNVYPLLHDCDAFILPSSYEGMPMTLIEAMGTALPVLASRVGGVPSMLKETEAVLVEPSEEDILQGLKRLLDEDTRKEIGPAACKRAGEEFSARGMALRYEKIFGDRL